MNPTKILICGPESVGKTTLTQALAKEFKLPYVEEYARKYFNKHPLSNDIAIIEDIAMQQISLETEAIKKHPIVFCDTGLINIKIWMQFYGFSTPSFINEFIEKESYDFALLLYPNIPWVSDGQRANPEDRIALFHSFREELENYNIPYSTIDSLEESRFKDSVAAVQNFLTKV